jgi:hypothetical protein
MTPQKEGSKIYSLGRGAGKAAGDARRADVGRRHRWLCERPRSEDRVREKKTCPGSRLRGRKRAPGGYVFTGRRGRPSGSTA